MKNSKNKLVIALFAAMALLPACTKQGQGMGTLSLQLKAQEDLIDVSTKSNVSDYTALPEASAFSLSVVDSNDDITPVSAGVPVSLPVGSYTAKALYGSCLEEGFDKPCFEGSEAFAITDATPKTVTVTVKLANCLVKLVTTEAFRNYYTDYSFTLTTKAGASIPFAKGETRAAFIDATSFSLSGSLTNQAGKEQSLSDVEFKNLNSASCYTVKIDAPNIGSGSITISFDDTVTDVDLGQVDINE